MRPGKLREQESDQRTAGDATRRGTSAPIRDSLWITRPRPTPIEPPMTQDTTVCRREVEVTNNLGLHMRPANKFVELALQFQAEIRVHYNGNEFNGKSILDLTSLAAERGTRLDVEARGPDAAQAIEALADLVRAQFYEDDNGESTEAQPGTEPAR
jgi:phosphocarrier protein HPr